MEEIRLGRGRMLSIPPDIAVWLDAQRSKGSDSAGRGAACDAMSFSPTALTSQPPPVTLHVVILIIVALQQPGQMLRHLDCAVVPASWNSSRPQTTYLHPWNASCYCRYPTILLSRA